MDRIIVRCLLIVVAIQYIWTLPLREDLIMKEIFDMLKNPKPAKNPPIYDHHRPRYEPRSGDNFAELETLIKDIMACPNWQIPGVAVGIVQNGKPVYQNGFGYRNLATMDPVDTQTLFGIGSCTKAFTTTLMAMAMDQGVLDLDTPVIEGVLPNFRMMEKQVTLDITPRDMTCHRTGLPRHDFLWASAPNITREQLVYTLQFLESNLEFRSQWEYNNLMFMTAGYMVGQLAGTTWESLVAEKIFTPLSMTSTNTDVTQSINTGNYAFPYGINAAGDVAPFPPDVNEMISVVGPAGSVNSNIEDLANWLIFHLNVGTFNGNRLVSATSLSATHAPSMAIYPTQYMPRPLFPAAFLTDAYGLGWEVGSYRGHLMLFHGGNTIGHSAMMFLFPLDNIGISVLSNMNGLGIPQLLIGFTAFDILLGYDTWLNGTNVCTFPCDFVHCESQKKKPTEEPVSKPLEDADEYSGIYDHPTYGTVTIDTNSLSWHAVTGNLTYLGNDRFVLTAVAPMLLDPVQLPVQFMRNFNGVVDSVRIPLEPTVPPIVFSNKYFVPRTCGFPAFTQTGVV